MFSLLRLIAGDFKGGGQEVLQCNKLFLGLDVHFRQCFQKGDKPDKALKKQKTHVCSGRWCGMASWNCGLISPVAEPGVCYTENLIPNNPMPSAFLNQVYKTDGKSKVRPVL